MYFFVGAALESLSAGRVAITAESCNTLIKAIVIAVRYAAQRVQFSTDEGKELALIEYQTHVNFILFHLLMQLFTLLHLVIVMFLFFYSNGGYSHMLLLLMHLSHFYRILV